MEEEEQRNHEEGGEGGNDRHGDGEGNVSPGIVGEEVGRGSTGEEPTRITEMTWASETFRILARVKAVRGIMPNWERKRTRGALGFVRMDFRDVGVTVEPRPSIRKKKTATRRIWSDISTMVILL